MARAPLLLQESLLFPYSDGLSFEQAILVKAGKEAAFAGVLANPPSSSFEIMHPAGLHGACSGAGASTCRIFIRCWTRSIRRTTSGVMGELDVRILMELFGGREMADALSPAWNGGIYYAAQRKSAVTPAEKESTASLGLIYYSRWKNRDSARSFMQYLCGADSEEVFRMLWSGQKDEAMTRSRFTRPTRAMF